MDPLNEVEEDDKIKKDPVNYRHLFNVKLNFLKELYLESVESPFKK